MTTSTFGTIGEYGESYDGSREQAEGRVDVYSGLAGDGIDPSVMAVRRSSSNGYQGDRGRQVQEHPNFTDYRGDGHAERPRTGQDGYAAGHAEASEPAYEAPPTYDAAIAQEAKVNILGGPRAQQQRILYETAITSMAHIIRRAVLSHLERPSEPMPEYVAIALNCVPEVSLLSEVPQGKVARTVQTDAAGVLAMLTGEQQAEAIAVAATLKHREPDRRQAREVLNRAIEVLSKDGVHPKTGEEVRVPPTPYQLREAIAMLRSSEYIKQFSYLVDPDQRKAVEQAFPNEFREETKETIRIVGTFLDTVVRRRPDFEDQRNPASKGRINPTAPGDYRVTLLSVDLVNTHGDSADAEISLLTQGILPILAAKPLLSFGEVKQFSLSDADEMYRVDPAGTLELLRRAWQKEVRVLLTMGKVTDENWQVASGGGYLLNPTTDGNESTLISTKLLHPVERKDMNSSSLSISGGLGASDHSAAPSLNWNRGEGFDGRPQGGGRNMGADTSASPSANKGWNFSHQPGSPLLAPELGQIPDGGTLPVSSAGDLYGLYDSRSRGWLGEYPPQEDYEEWRLAVESIIRRSFAQYDDLAAIAAKQLREARQVRADPGDIALPPSESDSREDGQRPALPVGGSGQPGKEVVPMAAGRNGGAARPVRNGHVPPPREVLSDGHLNAVQSLQSLRWAYRGDVYRTRLGRALHGGHSSEWYEHVHDTYNRRRNDGLIPANAAGAVMSYEEWYTWVKADKGPFNAF